MAFRKATMADAQVLYDWAMDEDTRSNSLNTNAFCFGDHVKWMEKKLSDESCHLLIYMNQGKSIGVCRLDINENRIATISYSIDKSFRGLGFGKKVVIELEEFARGIKLLQLKAVVKEKNEASQKILSSLGYVEEGQGGIFNYTKWLLDT